MRRIALVLAAAASCAHAQEAVIDVPVRVADVDAAARVGSVSCTVFADPEGATTNRGYLGTGSKWFEMKRGAFAGTVAVPVKLESAQAPKSYRCSLYLILKQGERTLTLPVARLVDPLANEYRDPFRRAPGQPFAPETRGTFP